MGGGTFRAVLKCSRSEIPGVFTAQLALEARHAAALFPLVLLDETGVTSCRGDRKQQGCPLGTDQPMNKWVTSCSI